VTEFKYPTPLETVIDMVEAVVDAGLDEDVMGWDNACRQVDVNELKRCIENDEAFEVFVHALKPNLREWLKRCLEEETEMKKDSGEL
jgi:hypothetical protein